LVHRPSSTQPGKQSALPQRWPLATTGRQILVCRRSLGFGARTASAGAATASPPWKSPRPDIENSTSPLLRILYRECGPDGISPFRNRSAYIRQRRLSVLLYLHNNFRPLRQQWELKRGHLRCGTCLRKYRKTLGRNFRLSLRGYAGDLEQGLPQFLIGTYKRSHLIKWIAHPKTFLTETIGISGE